MSTIPFVPSSDIDGITVSAVLHLNEITGDQLKNCDIFYWPSTATVTPLKSLDGEKAYLMFHPAQPGEYMIVVHPRIRGRHNCSKYVLKIKAASTQSI